MCKDLIVLGSGKMGYSIALEMIRQGFNIIGFTDIKEPLFHKSGFHKLYLGTDDVITNYSSEKVKLILALSDSVYLLKNNIYTEFKTKGYSFQSVIYPGSNIADTVELGEGVILFNSVTINSFTCIGNLTVINSNSSIDHDNVIGDNVYIGPSVTTGGSVNIGNNVFIGISATILPTKKIGDNSVIGAGALLTKDIPANEFWYGSPAKKIREGNVR